MTYINRGNTLQEADQLFVYGIFLGHKNQVDYGMSNPRYDTVEGFVTTGGYVVQAVPVSGADIQLTGLVVDVDPNYWRDIDELEFGYERIVVKTNSHGKAYMYAAPGTLDFLAKEELHEQEVKA